jgi:hypothetical protein
MIAPSVGRPSRRGLLRGGLLGTGLLAAALLGLSVAGVPAAAAQQGRQQHHHGHQLLGQPPGGLANGHYTLNTNPSGHRAHAHVHNGRVFTLIVIDPNGATVVVQRFHRGDWVTFEYVDRWHSVTVMYWFPRDWVA